MKRDAALVRICRGACGRMGSTGVPPVRLGVPPSRRPSAWHSVSLNPGMGRTMNHRFHRWHVLLEDDASGEALDLRWWLRIRAHPPNPWFLFRLNGEDSRFGGPAGGTRTMGSTGVPPVRLGVPPSRRPSAWHSVSLNPGMGRTMNHGFHRWHALLGEDPSGKALELHRWLCIRAHLRNSWSLFRLNGEDLRFGGRRAGRPPEQAGRLWYPSWTHASVAYYGSGALGRVLVILGHPILKCANSANLPLKNPAFLSHKLHKSLPTGPAADRARKTERYGRAVGKNQAALIRAHRELHLRSGLSAFAAARRSPKRTFELAENPRREAVRGRAERVAGRLRKPKSGRARHGTRRRALRCRGTSRFTPARQARDRFATLSSAFVAPHLARRSGSISFDLGNAKRLVSAPYGSRENSGCR